MQLLLLINFISQIMKQLLLLFFVATMISCQNDREPFVYENKYDKLSPEEYFKTYTTPDVLFQYTEVNKETGAIEGILIDNSGQVFTFKNEKLYFDLDNILAPISMVNVMLSASEKTDMTIDLADLVENYKRTRQVDIHLEEARTSVRNVDYYFVGYDVTHDDTGSETCSAIGVSENVYVQKVMKSSSIVNKSAQAKAIVKWLVEILNKSDA